MSVRFNVVLSDDLNQAIDQAVEESERVQQERSVAQGFAVVPRRA